MRIEMVLPTLDAAGMERVTARLVCGLANQGHDVGVTCIEHEGRLAADLRAQGHRVALVSSPGWGPNFHPGALARWFRQVRPDVVHVHSGAWLKAARAARMARVDRVIHTAHGLLDREPSYGPLLKRWAARYTDITIAVSEPLRRYLVTKAGLHAGAVTVIPNGVDTRVFAPGRQAAAMREALDVAPDALLLGHVARFAQVKNHALLLTAFARVCSDIPEAVLVLIGDGPLRSDIEKQIDHLALRFNVRLLGERHEGLAELYRQLDLFVLCSDAEGTSMSILEAMASGLPIVATHVGGSPDLLDNGQCGVLVPPRDAEKLAHAITNLLRDPSERLRLGGLARRRACDSYAEDRVVRLHEVLYAGDAETMDAHMLREATACAG